MNITIDSMEENDLNSVVAVHLCSFPGFFLTFLGPRFLRLLYTQILVTTGHVALVARDDSGKVLGFIVGVPAQARFYRDALRRRWLAFSIASLSAVTRQPHIIPRLVRALRYPNNSEHALAQALLMSIAVVPDASGQGIGRNLVCRFLIEMKSSGYTTVSLVTDRDNNDRVNRFYKDLGFSLAQTYATSEGRWLNEYLITL